ncbi:MAG: phosphoglycerate kinase [Candidatus Marinimicrobia bacterium]|nr:phosphoglycerate kinase [Candidatus Neomarinimicrobiota bacterium]
MNLKTLKDLDVKGKRVLVRVDFNVPLNGEKVIDDTRIRKALPTINYLREQEAKVVLMSHLGRPEGKVVEELRLEPVGHRLAELVDDHVLTLTDCVGEEVQRAIDGMEEGDVVLLENLRFYPGEKKNDKEFAAQLAELADVYVNDAFGAAHRAHASTEGVAHLIPAAAGLLLEKEIKTLSEVMANPARPFVAVIGGAKISTKMGVINKLIEKTDNLLLGGGLANTIVKAAGIEVGKSLVEEEMTEEAKKLNGKHDSKLKIPVDAVVALEATNISRTRIANINDIKPEEAIFDIGAETIKEYVDIILKAKTVIWNGPMGMFEQPNFANGTNSVAKAVAEGDNKSVIGGGETLEAVSKLALTDRVSFVSTGGGAMLEFMETGDLPALKPLQK